MINKLYKIVTVSITLTLIFTLSCSSDTESSPQQNSSSSLQYSFQQSSSSSTLVVSSSSSSSKQSSSSSVTLILSSSSNVITRLCSDGYEQTTEFCFNDKVYEKCNNGIYNPESYGCCNKDVYNLQSYGCCNKDVYDLQSYGCCNNDVYALSSNMVCKNNVLLPGCGSNSYDPETQFCSLGTVYTKCNGKTYPYPYKCVNNAVVGQCGSVYFDPETQFCNGTTSVGTVYTKCDGRTYDTKVYKCVNNVLVVPCGSSFFDPKTQFCLNDVVTNSNTTLIYSGQTYKTVKIGEQTWMAENLNFEVEGSRCYNDNVDRSDCSTYDVKPERCYVDCDTYGRLYNWGTAMSCNSGSCTSQISEKHQGICPNGWHIPSKVDWHVLMEYISPHFSSNGDNYNAGIKLKAIFGWNQSGNGTDNYGFSALPGGYGLQVPWIEYKDLGNSGSWWSSFDNNSACIDCSAAYSQRISYSSNLAYWENSSKSSLRSVRCVQD